MAKMSTQKFPLCVLTLQLAELLEVRGLHLHLYWRQRDSNVEADALTNDDKPGFPGHGFAEANRVHWAFTRGEWPVIDGLLALGAGFYAELEAQRAERTRVWGKSWRRPVFSGGIGPAWNLGGSEGS